MRRRLLSSIGAQGVSHLIASSTAQPLHAVKLVPGSVT
jgi:hypothetical protein